MIKLAIKKICSFMIFSIVYSCYKNNLLKCHPEQVSDLYLKEKTKLFAVLRYGNIIFFELFDKLLDDRGGEKYKRVQVKALAKNSGYK